MATIRPFAGIRYAQRGDLDFSKVIAPPYDVLDEAQKAELQARHPNNIVHVDLPWMPPKAAGPDHVYRQAATTLQLWLLEGALHRDPRAAFYPYMQSFPHHGRTYHRRGFIALVRLSPFGAGQVIPHEKTYPGPIEDRYKLMQATGVQLSPIFGLFNDPGHEITRCIYQNVSKPMLSGQLGDVKHDLWAEPSSDIENQVIDAMKAKAVYIADGHHRYTTALHYLAEMERANGGPLPEPHPANWCMFVLVSLADEGLIILPTHRMVGGLSGFSLETFRAALGDTFEWTAPPWGEATVGPAAAEQLARSVADAPPHTLGVYDGRHGWLLHLRKPDVLANLEPGRSEAWRGLDVAIVQRYVIESVLSKFATGGSPTTGYSADTHAAAAAVDGGKYQVALLLQSTPLRAMEDVGRAGEVMPQKSTYFYPKLATGMVLYPLR